MPEIGLDDEPITPVIRELTVTNRNPNNTIMTAADQPARQVGGDQMRRGDHQHQPERAEETTDIGRSRSVRGTPPVDRSACPTAGRAGCRSPRR